MKEVLKDNLGYFDNENLEYVITNMYPKRPLQNYIWSEDVVINSDQFGFGDATAGINGERRLIDSCERLLFIKNKRTGEIYSNRNDSELAYDEFECHIGIGYHKMVFTYKGVRASLKLTVPPHGYAVQYDVEVENISNAEKELTIYPYFTPHPRVTWHHAYGYAEKDEVGGGLFYSHVAYNSETEYGYVYFAAEKPFDSYAVTKEDFIGTYGSFANPKGLKEDKLCSKGSCFMPAYAAAISYNVALTAGEKKRFSFATAIGRSKEEAVQTAKKYATSASFDVSLKYQKEEQEQAFSRYQINLPQDDYLQTLINVWLKRQVSLGKTWGRVYGKGFRDRMQDVTAFTAFDHKTARKIILETLSHQRENGNPIRMFEPDTWEVYNDGAVWIPDAVIQYVKESGDFSILDEVVPYIEGSRATVFEHIEKGLEYLMTDVGKRGLTLFRVGDWNDSTNGAGLLGKGESVWTSIATVRALKQHAELCNYCGKDEQAKKWLKKAEEMTKNIMQYGYIDGHFIHGYDDWDNIVGGGDASKEGSFCINMQTWAVLAQIGDEEFQKNLLDQVEEKTACAFGYKLANTPYTKPVKGVGRTSYFQPGCYENASVYVHANMFKAVADCMLGRSENALNTVEKVTYRNNPNSGVEPYAITNMYLGPDCKTRGGDAPMAWITGSAGWMYRVLTEFIVGVKADFDGLKIEPCIPNAWKLFSLEREYRSAKYKLNFVKTGEFGIYADDKKLEGNKLPLLQEGEYKVFQITF